jgi:hypothetical protein
MNCPYCDHKVIADSNSGDWGYSINPDESLLYYHIECLEMFDDAALFTIKEWQQ